VTHAEIRAQHARELAAYYASGKTAPKPTPLATKLARARGATAASMAPSVARHAIPPPPPDSYPPDEVPVVYDVPTVHESGQPDFEVDSWYAMFVPAKTPRPVIERLNRALNTVLAEPLIRERLLAQGPRVIGFGVYIWNVEETTRIVAMLKVVAPEVVVVLGGPEVSFETETQRICALADHVVTGWGEVTFAALVRQILDGPKPLMKVHAGAQPPLDQLVFPYGEYTDEDIARRHLYVEASRGCPYKCEFCLSALDKTAWPFDLACFLG
jgi:hypothetical protein